LTSLLSRSRFRRRLPLLGETKVDKETECTARRFLDLVQKRYVLAAALLFGSRARSNDGGDRDADIAVVLRGTPGDRTDAAIDMAGIAFDAMLETGILVDPLPLWEDEWNHPERFSNPALLANIRRDGIPL
jgi:uncharacterized protein